MPPPGPALPGSYDFARTAWFSGIGATGRILGPVRIVAPRLKRMQDFWNGARNALSTIGSRWRWVLQTGPVGSALLVGTRGSIEEADAEALRNSGMAHLLSVSGLHVTAVVGGTFILVAKLACALWPWLALRVSVPLIAAGCAAGVAIVYTLLTGAEVPTVRACIAALLDSCRAGDGAGGFVAAPACGGCHFVLLFWPEALAGPSFQLSFAAVGTIIICTKAMLMRRWLHAARRIPGDSFAWHGNYLACCYRAWPSNWCWPRLHCSISTKADFMARWRTLSAIPLDHLHRHARATCWAWQMSIWSIGFGGAILVGRKAGYPRNLVDCAFGQRRPGRCRHAARNAGLGVWNRHSVRLAIAIFVSAMAMACAWADWLMRDHGHAHGRGPICC
jgi:ComEC/Rec2-related protein